MANQIYAWNEILWITSEPLHPRINLAKFGWNWTSGFSQEDFLSSLYNLYNTQTYTPTNKHTHTHARTHTHTHASQMLRWHKKYGCTICLVVMFVVASEFLKETFFIYIGCSSRLKTTVVKSNVCRSIFRIINWSKCLCIFISLYIFQAEYRVCI
jgi:hypothetical protein